MVNFNLSIDLAKFIGAQVTISQNGEEVIQIPLEVNHLKRAQTGSVVAYITATKKRQLGRYGDTHFLKQRFSKEEYALLSEEQRKIIPFLGNVYYPNLEKKESQPQQHYYTPNINASDLDDSIF